jgi:hypothetical protein
VLRCSGTAQSTVWGVTTGVVAGGDFFYMANIQDDKETGYNPITMLKLHL